MIKSQFHTPLRVEEISKDRWRLLDPLVYESRRLGGKVIIPQGWETDLDSIPRWLPLAYAALHGEARAPAVVHDWAYTYAVFRVQMSPGVRMIRGISQKQADALLYEAMRTRRNRPALWKAYSIWVGLRVGGWVAWNQHREENLQLPR